MFSLIITIISIALVAALALATIYYGGSAFNKSSAAATASKLLTQSQQILGADRLYRADHDGAMPPSMQALVDEGYLKAIPVAIVDSKFSAQAATVSWVMVSTADGRGYQFTSPSVDEDSCKNVNQMSFGQNGILNSVFNGFKTQCYGPDTANLTVLVLSDPALFTPGGVASGLPSSPVYKSGGSPTASDWTVAPTAGSGTGGTGGSGSGSGTGGSGSGSGGSGSGSGGIAAAPNQLEMTLTQVDSTHINVSWRVASGPMTLADFRAYGNQAGGYMSFGVNMAGPTSATYVGDLGPTGGTLSLFNPWSVPDWTLADTSYISVAFTPSYGAPYWTQLYAPFSTFGATTQKVCFTFPPEGRDDTTLNLSGQAGPCP